MLPRLGAGGHAPAPLVLPSPWQYGVQAALGACLPTVFHDQGYRVSGSPGDAEEATASQRDRITLDLRTLVFSRPAAGVDVRLSRAEAWLVAFLALAGDAGVSERDVKQLSFELDRIQGGNPASLDDWFPQWRELPERDARRGHWAHSLKTRANESLHAIGLQIQCDRGKGTWGLPHPGGPPHPIEITGTLWELLGQFEAPTLPPDLSPQQAAVWQALERATPSGLPLPALAAALGESDDEAGIKRSLDAVARLRRTLDRRSAPARVQRLHKGHYALIPAPPSPVPRST